VIFNLTTLDTTAKYYVRDHSMPLLYCVQREFAHYPERNFCNVQPKQGETSVMKSKSSLQCANCSQEPNNRFFVHKYRNPNVKKGQTENRSGYQNRKTGDFERRNRKTDLKSDQNRKTEKPNAPLVIPSVVFFR